MKSFTLVLALLASGSALSVSAQSNFLYVNNDVSTSNTVSAYSVNHAGVPTELPGSPFATGGSGSTGPAVVIGSRQITTAKHYLYAANAFDSRRTSATARFIPFAPVGGTMCAASPARNSRP